MNDKMIYQPAGIAIVELDRDLLTLSAGASLGESDKWDEFDYGHL